MDQLILGHFETEGEPSRGGYAMVYKAKHRSLKTVVALKRLNRSRAQDSTARARFIKEAKIAAKLRHKNIIEIYDLYDLEDEVFITMPYLPKNMAEWFAENSNPDWEILHPLFQQIAEALDFAHSSPHYVLHRDVKPENILLGKNNHVYLSDFGLARALDMPRMTNVGEVVGTALYMSPEQAADKPLDGRGDQYSLATIAYQYLVNALPFDGDTSTSLSIQKNTQEPIRPSQRNSAIPHEVDDVLLKALATLPEKRYLTCAEFVDSLDRAYLASTQRRYREILAQAEASLNGNDFDEALQFVQQATRLLPQRSEGSVLAETIEEKRRRFTLYNEGVKQWRRAQEEGQLVLDLVPDYPDPEFVLSDLGLKEKPKPPFDWAAKRPSLVRGAAVGIILALLTGCLSFLWITRDLGEGEQGSPFGVVLFWLVLFGLIVWVGLRLYPYLSEEKQDE